jgi:hypothetical protein
MKTMSHRLRLLAAAIICLGPAGCVSHNITTPIGHGYEEVTHPSRNPDSARTSARTSLRHRSADGKTTLVWPSLFGVSEVFHDGLVIFVGDLAYVHPENPDDPRGAEPRLFVEKFPGVPVDITSDILWRWAQSAGRDFSKTQEALITVSPGESQTGLELQLEFYARDPGWPDKAALQLSWQQVTNIVRDVSAKGVLRRDVRWDSPYISR